MRPDEPTRRAARRLRFAAVQFAVLTAAAMAFYAGGTWWEPRTAGYAFTRNFLSDLGMTRAFSGERNHVSAVMFAFALASLGATVIAFAWRWRGFAFAHGRARGAGLASAFAGTLCGVAFIGVGVTPFDRALDLHNLFVLSGFGLLPVYVAALAVVMWRNAGSRLELAACLAYLAAVLGYLVLIFFGPRLATPHGHMVQVIGQKLIAGASMAYIVALSTLVARR